MLKWLRSRLCAFCVVFAVYIITVLFAISIIIESGNPRHNKVLANKATSAKVRSFDVDTSLRVSSRRKHLVWCKSLCYQQEPGPVVALASFPGSGNTWVRYLLQQATGIYTGSVYKDYGLLKNGFPAESVVNGSVSVVKTHEWGPSARQPFDKAVLLVRNASAAIQAEFNRQSGGHIGFASPDRYLRSRGRYWNQFVTEKLTAWKHMNLDWIYNFTGPIHIVYYEELISDLQIQMCNILNFLDLPFTEKDLQCAIERQEGIYRRKKTMNVVSFNPFTKSMKRSIEREENIVYSAIEKFKSSKSVIMKCLKSEGELSH